jgi:hypothetical protein
MNCDEFFALGIEEQLRIGARPSWRTMAIVTIHGPSCFKIVGPVLFVTDTQEA